MRIFLAGIMQGSHLGSVLHNQNYRSGLKDLLIRHLPGASVYDPLADHQDSLVYDDARAREVFYFHNRMCREVDVLIAFVPEASMGTAIEMWEAFQHGRVVIAISPMQHNWAIKFCSHAMYTDIDSFERALTSGQVQAVIEQVHRDACSGRGQA